MAKRELLKLPGTFEEALAGLVQTPPPPKDEKPKRKRARKAPRKKAR
jgi:hypothetical protein